MNTVREMSWKSQGILRKPVAMNPDFVMIVISWHKCFMSVTAMMWVPCLSLLTGKNATYLRDISIIFGTPVSPVHKNDKSYLFLPKYHCKWPSFVACGSLRSHVFLTVVHSSRRFRETTSRSVRNHTGSQRVQTYAQSVGMWNWLETGCLSCKNISINMMQTYVKYKLSYYWQRLRYQYEMVSN